MKSQALSEARVSGFDQKDYTSSLLPQELVQEWEESLPDFPKLDKPERFNEPWSLKMLLEMVKHIQHTPEQPVHPLFIMRLLVDAEETMSKKYVDPVCYAKIPERSMADQYQAERTNRLGPAQGRVGGPSRLSAGSRFFRPLSSLPCSWLGSSACCHLHLVPLPPPSIAVDLDLVPNDHGSHARDACGCRNLLFLSSVPVRPSHAAHPLCESDPMPECANPQLPTTQGESLRRRRPRTGVPRPSAAPHPVPSPAS